MMLRAYEMVYIVQPDLEEEAVNGLLEKFSALITADGGEVVQVDHWGKRRLAYEIRDFRDGNYFLVNFKGLPRTAGELDRIFKLTDEVLRFMIIRREK